jgi:hypothetical protein
VNARAGAQALPRAAGASRVAALSTAVRQQLALGLPSASPRSAVMTAASARQQLTVRCSPTLVCPRHRGREQPSSCKLDLHTQRRPLCRYSSNESDPCSWAGVRLCSVPCSTHLLAADAAGPPPRWRRASCRRPTAASSWTSWRHRTSTRRSSLLHLARWSSATAMPATWSC